MVHRSVIHRDLRGIAHTMLDFIRISGKNFQNGWVPATYVKRELDLNVLCYPKEKTQHGKQGWLFSILARMLQDEELLTYRFDGKHAYYRAVDR